MNYRQGIMLHQEHCEFIGQIDWLQALQTLQGLAGLQ